MPGVVPGLNFACRAWSRPERKVITPTPVYYPFLHAAGYNDRPVSHLPMQLVEDRWVPDFEALETLAPEADLLLLCNPHNPGGTVFTRDELLRIADIAERHDLVVCSDEIHCDLLLEPGVKHIPFASRITSYNVCYTKLLRTTSAVMQGAAEILVYGTAVKFV